MGWGCFKERILGRGGMKASRECGDGGFGGDWESEDEIPVEGDGDF
jgi:hypothetical protein